MNTRQSPSLSAAWRCGVSCLGAALLLSAPAVAADLSSVKALYAGASYDEALKELEAIDPATVDANQIHQYRALCFLALGRTGDAERSLQALVARSPLYRLDEAQVSPRLVGMFRDIRRRTLADAALERYTKAKGAYERKEYDTASGLFREVVAIVADPDASGEAATLADVKQLAEGFLVLSAAALKAAEAPPPPPELPPATPPPSTDIAQGPVPPAIYAAENPDVVAPVDIERPVPRWTPVAGQLANVPRRGVLEVVIDETGSVESARLHRPIFPTYDNLLLDAAQKWRFKPATRNGTPVKYRKVLEIVLQPASSRQDE